MHEWFSAGGSGRSVDVAALMDSKASNLLGAIVQHGALVGLYTTRDGGALGIQVTVDGASRREYFRDADEAVAWLEVADAVIRDIWELDERQESPTPVKKPRRRL